MIRMKRTVTQAALGAALAAAAVALSGCASGLFRVNAEASPAVQKVQAEANAKFTGAVADRLRYCSITGTIDLELKVSAGAGVANTAGLNCPAKPWETAADQAELIAVAVRKAVAEAMASAAANPAPAAVR